MNKTSKLGILVLTLLAAIAVPTTVSAKTKTQESNTSLSRGVQQQSKSNWWKSTGAYDSNGLTIYVYDNSDQGYYDLPDDASPLSFHAKAQY